MDSFFIGKGKREYAEANGNLPVILNNNWKREHVGANGNLPVILNNNWKREHVGANGNLPSSEIYLFRCYFL